MTPQVLECAIALQRGAKGSKQMVHSPALSAPAPLGRLPRIAKLLALAHKFDDLLRQEIVGDYASLAHLGQVSRARITQIVNLLYLAPDIQEEILFLPRKGRGGDPIPLHRLQPIARTLDWQQQRVLWRQLLVQKDVHFLEESSGNPLPTKVTDGRHARQSLE
jgi:hypothetical protein